MTSTHIVESTPETVRSGYLDPAAKPVAVIQPGDTVRYPNTWTHWGNEAKFEMSFADREPLRHRYPHGPYSMLGPVEVTGAQPGDVVEVSITALRTIGWGWNSFPLGVGALPHDFAEPYVHYFTFDDARTIAAYEHGIALPMAPFLGVVAAEPAGQEPVSAIVSGGGAALTGPRAEDHAAVPSDLLADGISVRAGRGGWSDEVVALFDVLDEAGVGGLPAQEFLGDGARGGHVGAQQGHQHALVFPGGQGPGGQVQVPADGLGDLADGHAFVTDGVEHCAGGSLLDG